MDRETSDAIIRIGLYILGIVALIGIIFAIASTSNTEDKKVDCHKIISCEKYKCLADKAIFKLDTIDYNLKYQNCLLEQGARK